MYLLINYCSYVDTDAECVSLAVLAVVYPVVGMVAVGSPDLIAVFRS